MLRPISLCLLAGLLLAGCRKVDFGPNDGINYRDAANQSGPQDPTDWQADGNWKKVERKLFDKTGVDVESSGSGGHRYLSLYPNPMSPVARRATLLVDMRTTGPARITLVLVDKKFKQKGTFTLEAVPDRSGVFQVALEFPADTYKQNELYRMYYAVYDGAKKLYYKGHGDFKIAD